MDRQSYGRAWTLKDTSRPICKKACQPMISVGNKDHWDWTTPITKSSARPECRAHGCSPHPWWQYHHRNWCLWRGVRPVEHKRDIPWYTRRPLSKQLRRFDKGGRKLQCQHGHGPLSWTEHIPAQKGTKWTLTSSGCVIRISTQPRHKYKILTGR